MGIIPGYWRCTKEKKLIEKVFSDCNALNTYIETHLKKEVLQKRIKATVKKKRLLIENLALNAKSKGAGDIRFNLEVERRKMNLLDDSLENKSVNVGEDYQTENDLTHDFTGVNLTLNSDNANESLDCCKRYVFLVNNYCIDPAIDFPEIPAYLSICEYEKLLEHFRDLDFTQIPRKVYGMMSGVSRAELFKALSCQFSAKLEYLSNKLAYLAGDINIIPNSEEYTLLNNISLKNILDKKADIPLKPNWSEELYSLEANRLNKKPALLDEKTKKENKINDTHQPLKEEIQGPKEQLKTKNGCGSHSYELPYYNDLSFEAEKECSCEGKSQACNLDELYALAGANRLKQPEPSNDKNKFYTFPGQELGLHDNTYYDLSIIVPIKCGAVINKKEGIQRDFTSAKILSRQIISLNSFILKKPLSSTFKNIFTELNELFNTVFSETNIANLESKDYLKSYRKHLRNMQHL